ncbi:MAG: FHA domain-containing protein [Anaerolineae bacterium]|jgi:hypothetical protein|nr:FHA domain-containing protein [Anaerolineae bacterium]
MTKAWQIYYNAVLGAIGGLLGWLIIGQIPTGDWDVHLANAVSGLVIGLFIGGSIGAVEGLFVKRSVGRTLLGVLGGAFAGALSGALGLLLGGLAFVLLGELLGDASLSLGSLNINLGLLLARMLGWMALGLFLGLGQGILSLRIKRASFSLLGGTIAGLVGGAVYEVLTQLFIQQSGEIQVFLSAVALVLIGVALGGIIAATVELAKDARTIVLTGRRANTEVSIIGKATLGSSDACDIYIPDEGVEKQHGILEKRGDSFVLINNGHSQPISAGGKVIPPGGSQRLDDGMIITVGAVQLKFRVK